MLASPRRAASAANASRRAPSPTIAMTRRSFDVSREAASTSTSRFCDMPMLPECISTKRSARPCSRANALSFGPGAGRRSEVGQIVGGAAGKAPRVEARAVRAQNRDAVPCFAVDRAEAAAIAAGRVQRATGHDRDVTAVTADEILGELGQQLAGRRLIG